MKPLIGIVASCLLISGIIILVFVGFATARKRASADRSKARVNAMSMRELIDLYQHGSGGESEAGRRFKSLGSKARDELIQILDSIQSSDDGDTIVEILHVYFPSEESYLAVGRYADRVGDPKRREFFHAVQNLMKEHFPRGK